MASPVSRFIRTVSLKDWWLTEAAKDSGGSRFAVTGFESGGLQAARVFSSAPILKRYDLFTLKAADGVFVLLRGPINKERTCESGFSPEVFKHFLIGFPSNWEESAQKCFVRGAVSEATSCADFNSESNAGSEMGNVTLTPRQPFRKDSGSTERAENYRDEAEEADIQLEDDQNIHSAKDGNTDVHLATSGCDKETPTNTHSAEEADIQLQDDQNIPSAKDGNTDVHLATSGCDKDTPINTSRHTSDVASTEKEVIYYLRNRTVPSIKVTAVPQDGKRIKDIGLGKSILKNNSIPADKGMQSTRGEIGNKSPAPDCTGSRTTNAQRQLEHEFATLTEENGNDVPRDAGELTKSNSHHSYGGKSCQREKSKKSRSRSAGPTVKGVSNTKSSTRVRSLENSGANVHACNTTPVAPNSTRSCPVAAGDNSVQDKNGKADKNVRQTLGHFSHVRLKVQKRICKDDTLLEVFSFRDADKLEASVVRRFCVGKSYESKKKKNQRSTSRSKSNPKTGDSKRERNASQGSTPKKARRKLDYAEQKTPTSAGKKKGPDELSQSSAPRTSRSGRLLLPTMEFWRNQLPIYDADHGISGVKDGTTVLKFQRGSKSRGKT